MPTPSEILDLAFERARANPESPFIHDTEIVERIDAVCRTIQNKAGIRLLLACALAKTDTPTVDIRKPYTEIGDPDAYSGRKYDEQYIGPFIHRHELPCNPTTAFLTPALRNRNVTLTLEIDLVGKPPQLYQSLLYLLNAVYTRRITSDQLLGETIRCLLKIRDEKEKRLASLLADLASSKDSLPLSAERIVKLIEQHLACPNSSRLPVLVVAAAYESASSLLREQILPLSSHNAADEQTGALGDIEIALLNEENIVTSYEMKAKRVTREDIARALQKIDGSNHPIDNYIFITTEPIDEEVKEYARTLYELTGGTEIVVLDCISFLRHFLHFFHRTRGRYLDAYQAFLLKEPDSAVSQPLKEVFLTLRRQAAESA